MCTRMVILLAAAGLSLAGAANAAFADPQPGHSDGNGYDRDGVFNDGNGYDRDGVFNDGNGYDRDGVFNDDNSYADSNGSPYGFNCDDNGGYDADGIDNCGWYDGFFYPGFGNFVFDRDHHRHEMTDRQHDFFTRHDRGPDGGRRFGPGSSGGGPGRPGFGGSRGGMSSGFHGGGRRG